MARQLFDLTIKGVTSAHISEIVCAAERVGYQTDIALQGATKTNGKRPPSFRTNPNTLYKLANDYKVRQPQPATKNAKAFAVARKLLESKGPVPRKTLVKEIPFGNASQIISNLTQAGYLEIVPTEDKTNGAA